MSVCGEFRTGQKLRLWQFRLELPVHLHSQHLLVRNISHHRELSIETLSRIDDRPLGADDPLVALLSIDRLSGVLRIKHDVVRCNRSDLERSTTLGLDRDSELVAHIYDERDTSVKRLVKSVIDVAKEKGKKIGICGQAPSDFPEFATFLVECGIDSMSLNPDTVVKTKLDIAKKEQELGIKP